MQNEELSIVCLMNKKIYIRTMVTQIDSEENGQKKNRPQIALLP